MGIEIEIWAPIPDAEGFEVSNLGRCRSVDTGKPRLIKPQAWKRGNNQPRMRCLLDRRAKYGWAKNIYLHNAVAAAFCNIQDGKITFKDGDPANCRASNLISSWQEQPENLELAKTFETDIGKKIARFIAGDDDAMNDDLKAWAPRFVSRLSWDTGMCPTIAEEAVWDGFFVAMRRARLGYLSSEKNIPAYFFISCKNSLRTMRYTEKKYVSEWIRKESESFSQIDRLICAGGFAL